MPKVIDFGLAKATGGLRLSEHSLNSAFGTVAGTPLYMAPEQASFNALDIDTRADIYALGVILYELLSGSTPIDRDTFKKAALDEMLRLIREFEPPTPSSRISASGARARIAAIRQTEPARLGRFVRGELDWIVMKALSKERQRRYESPIAFAQDIERFLNHEPVSAGPPSAAYRFKKFVRRHRVPAVAASIVLLTLIVGIVGTTFGLIEANRQEGIADVQREKAQERLAEIEKINGRLSESVQRETRANANLTAANSLVEARFNLAMEAIQMFHTGVSKDVLLKNDNLKPVRDRLLNDAAGFYKRLEGLLSSQADRKSRRALAQAYGQMGDLARDIGATDRAVASYRHALEVILELAEGAEADDDAEAGDDVKYRTGFTLTNLGNLLRETGRKDEARTAFEESRRLLEGLTRAHPNVTRFQDSLATNYNNIGNLLHETGKAREALESHGMARSIWQKLVEAEPNNAAFQTGLAMGFHNIGHLLKEAGNWREALASYQSERMIFQRLVDANPADAQNQIGLARAHLNVGITLSETGRRGEALVSYQAEQAIFQRLADANRAVTRYQFELALSHFSIGGVLRATGRPGMALASYESARTLLQRLVVDNPTFTDFQRALGSCHGDIAELQGLTGKLKEALDSYKAARAIQQKLVDDNPAIRKFQSSLASTHIGMSTLLKKTGKPEEALLSNRAARAIMQKLVDANPADTSFQGRLADYDMLIGTVLSEIGKSEEALASYQSARALQQKLAEANPTVTDFQSGLAICLTQTGILLKELGKLEEALATCKAARAIKQALFDANPTGLFEQINLANVDLETGDILRLIGQSVEARASFERALAIIERLNKAQPTFFDHSVVYQVFGLKGLGATQQTANQTVDAVASWRSAIAKAERLRSPSNELLLYLAGCHARLGAIAGMPGSGLSAAEGQAERHRAIVRLRQALAGGYRNVNSMKRDLDLESLRASPTFNRSSWTSNSRMSRFRPTPKPLPLASLPVHRPRNPRTKRNEHAPCPTEASEAGHVSEASEASGKPAIASSGIHQVVFRHRLS